MTATTTKREPTVAELYAIYEQEVETAGRKVDDAREAVADAVRGDPLI